MGAYFRPPVVALILHAKAMRDHPADHRRYGQDGHKFSPVSSGGLMIDGEHGPAPCTVGVQHPHGDPETQLHHDAAQRPCGLPAAPPPTARSRPGRGAAVGTAAPPSASCFAAHGYPLTPQTAPSPLAFRRWAGWHGLPTPAMVLWTARCCAPAASRACATALGESVEAGGAARTDWPRRLNRRPPTAHRHRPPCHPSVGTPLRRSPTCPARSAPRAGSRTLDPERSSAGALTPLGLPAEQGVILVYPRTSNWDFPWAQCWPNGRWVQAHMGQRHPSLPVLGRWMRPSRIPVSAQQLVVDIARQMQAARVANASGSWRAEARARSPRAGAPAPTKSQCKRACRWGSLADPSRPA